jgi:DNA-binding NtrC family response regulator
MSGLVLLVDDDGTFRTVLSSELERIGLAVERAGTGEEAIAAVAKREPDVVLLDLELPDRNGLDVLRVLRETHPAAQVVMLTGHGSIDTAIEAIRRGAFDYVAKPCPLDELEVRIQRALERRALLTRTSLLERALTPSDPTGAFLGDSPAFAAARELLSRVAPSDSSVLISGETGSGKEMAAKLLHARSPRHGRPFVVVECAALQEDLLQSELFGHERGAFTGADRAKPGLFEVANGGSIFLDEIGEVSPAAQVKLLRVLDASTFRRVGGTAELHVDVRVIAATNRDLTALVRQGLFREDLYYRLRTIAVEMPPLRARAGDVELLAGHFVRRLNARYGFEKRIGAEAMALLHRHPWPGNVRELLHAVEAAAILCTGVEILPAHLPGPIRGDGTTAAAPEPGSSGSLASLAELERQHIERVLGACGGRRAQAASTLGISERNLYRKLREFGLLD